MDSLKRTSVQTKPRSVWERIGDHWQLYLMLSIPLILTIIYKYVPMYGIQIAFRDYKSVRGMWGSEWVGFKWFQRFFSSPNCVRMIKNTILLSLYSLLWSFPIPIILSLAINQIRFKKFKQAVQTILYAPHFISIMVVCGMLRIFLSPSGGLINLIAGTGIDFLSEASAFRTIYIASGIWQDAGWGIIVYMASLANLCGAGEQYHRGRQPTQRDIFPCGLYGYPLLFPVQIRRTCEVDIFSALVACQGQGGDFAKQNTTRP